MMNAMRWQAFEWKLAVWVLLVVALPAGAQGLPSTLQGCLQEGGFLFSTEVDFVTRGPVPPDGNPIVSDGDLLGGGTLDCPVCARNADLLAVFGPMPDLGLDAVDVVGEGEDTVVYFSTELDAPPELAPLRAGDLLASNGAVIPNQTLLQRFSSPLARDLGLDAVHGIGDPRALLAFWTDASEFARADWLNDPERLLDLLETNDVDLWISTEGTAPSPTAPSWLDGDLLSVRTGSIVQRNSDLLPVAVPAGVPSRGVDFGLDAVTADRSGQVDSLMISVEISRLPEPEFGESDLLGRLLGWRASGEGLVACFEPASVPLGLDALSLPVPEPGLAASLTASLGLLAAMGGLAARQGARSIRRGPGMAARGGSSSS